MWDNGYLRIFTGSVFHPRMELSHPHVIRVGLMHRRHILAGAAPLFGVLVLCSLSLIDNLKSRENGISSGLACAALNAFFSKSTDASVAERKKKQQLYYPRRLGVVGGLQCCSASRFGHSRFFVPTPSVFPLFWPESQSAHWSRSWSRPMGGLRLRSIWWREAAKLSTGDLGSILLTANEEIAK